MTLGALSSLSLPPYNFFLINFFSYSLLFIFLFRKLSSKYSKRVFFYYGWLFGFGFFLTNLYWITISLTFDKDFSFLIPIALLLIPTFLALFYGIVTLVFCLFKLTKVLSAFFLFSLLFGLIEFVRGNIFTGFPWNLIVYSLSDYQYLLSFLPILGTYSLNLLIISFFSAPAVYFLKKEKKEIIVCILLLLMPAIFFSYNLFYKKKFYNSEVNENSLIIRIIGSNISLDRFYDETQTETVINDLIELSAPNQNQNIFFIWPEGIIPNIYQDELNIYADLFKKRFSKNHIIGLGITNRVKNDNDYKYFNSFSIFDNDLNLIHNYNKINLVPFGEFLPFENFLNRIGLKTITNKFGSFNKGENREIIQINRNFNTFKFLPLICYEIIYSGRLSESSSFNFILNISEDGWFGKSIGPKQHFAHSIFRAIETGKYIIRSSNNGMTAIINPLGEIEQKVEYGAAGFIDFTKRIDIDSTLFSKYGNKIFILLILLYIFLIISFNRCKSE